MLKIATGNQFKIAVESLHTGPLQPNYATALAKARFPLSELTAQVNAPSWRVTGFHYPSTRAVLTGERFH